jgi:hypothetical protein
LYPNLPFSDSGEIIVGEASGEIDSQPFFCSDLRLPNKRDFDISTRLGALAFVADAHGHLTGDVFMVTTTFHVK